VSHPPNGVIQLPLATEVLNKNADLHPGGKAEGNKIIIEFDTRKRDQHGFEQSMSRADETYDNAHAEILFSRYKAELLEGGAFADFEQARSETFAYIEGYYNRARRRSALGYLSPENFERAFYQRTQRPE
jgi:transposase InsO family protein